MRTWYNCGKHAAPEWRPPQGAGVVLEETSRHNGKLVRYDAVVYNEGTRIKVIEVKHTHGTDPNDRPGGTVELRADAVVKGYTADAGTVYVDNCMTELCPECEEAKAAQERWRIEEERARQEAIETADAFARVRREAAERMIVSPTPGFCVTSGTDVPEVSQEEIDRLREERRQRQVQKEKRKHTAKITAPRKATRDGLNTYQIEGLKRNNIQNFFKSVHEEYIA